jgi:hypothetical protein
LAPVPTQDPRVIFAESKRDFPGQLIDFDTELGQAEEFGMNLDANEIKAARGHLNKGFAAYAQHFQGDTPTTNNVFAARDAVAGNLDKARRHLLLADPATAPQVAEMDAAKREADVEAGRMAAARAKVEADYVAQQQAQVDNMFGPAGFARPVARRTTVQLTPFGIMIGSF